MKPCFSKSDAAGLCAQPERNTPFLATQAGCCQHMHMHKVIAHLICSAGRSMHLIRHSARAGLLAMTGVGKGGYFCSVISARHILVPCAPFNCFTALAVPAGQCKQPLPRGGCQACRDNMKIIVPFWVGWDRIFLGHWGLHLHQCLAWFHQDTGCCLPYLPWLFLQRVRACCDLWYWLPAFWQTHMQRGFLGALPAIQELRPLGQRSCPEC